VGGVCAGVVAGALARPAPPGVRAIGIASCLPRLLATNPPPPTRAASTRIPIIHHARFESSEFELKSGLVAGVESGTADSPAVAAVSGATGVESGTADSPAVAAVSGATGAEGVAGSERAADSEIVSAGVGAGDVASAGLGFLL